MQRFGQNAPPMTEPDTVRAEAGVFNSIRDATRMASPQECCGLLVGRREGREIVLSAVHPSTNLAQEPERSFEIDPAIRLRLQRELRGSGQKVVGLYHSHPGGATWPSHRDREAIFEHGLVWIIAAPRDGDLIDLSTWLAEKNGFREMRIVSAEANDG